MKRMVGGQFRRSKKEDWIRDFVRLDCVQSLYDPNTFMVKCQKGTQRYLTKQGIPFVHSDTYKRGADEEYRLYYERLEQKRWECFSITIMSWNGPLSCWNLLSVDMAAPGYTREEAEQEFGSSDYRVTSLWNSDNRDNILRNIDIDYDTSYCEILYQNGGLGENFFMFL